MGSQPNPLPESLLESLLHLASSEDQFAFLLKSANPLSDEHAEAISATVRRLCPRDPARAEILAETNMLLARHLDTTLAAAYARRSIGDVLSTMKRSEESLVHYDASTSAFEQLGMSGELGRTLCAQMENLTYLGRYSEAAALGERARAALTEADSAYLPTLDIAFGNLFYRLNRYADSLRHYENALGPLKRAEDHVRIAAVGLNKAHVLNDMNRFDEAYQSFLETKRFCDQQGLALWAAITDRGISQMEFMRGNYSAALRTLERVRDRHQQLQDDRRVGLCDMDRSEIYLQLNLYADAAALARNAIQTFDRLHHRYEAARCLTFEGIAESMLHKTDRAAAAFLRARSSFVEEGNDVWVAVVDVCRAQLLFRQKFYAAGRALAEAAAVALEPRDPVRAAYSRLLSAQCSQAMGQVSEAMTEAEAAVDLIGNRHVPWIQFELFNTLGRLRETVGAVDEAESFYLKSIQCLESLRGSIRLDELRLSFGRDKYQVYENLVGLTLRKGKGREAFRFVERSKSRTLLDLLSNNLDTAFDPASSTSPRLQETRKLREELNILYNRLSDPSGFRNAAEDLVTRREIEDRERHLVQKLRELAHEEDGLAALESMDAPEVEDIQEALDEDQALILYHSVGSRFHAFVLTRHGFHVLPALAGTDSLRASVKGLQFQLSKFRLSPEYWNAHQDRLLAATQHHLSDLYRQLIAPLRSLIEGCRLVVVPHGLLHYVPFHALYDGSEYLADRHELSYAASASVFRLCRNRRMAPTEEDLILGVPDDRTPAVLEEVELLQDLLPAARVLVGSEATAEQLRRHAPAARRIHIAAHGVFRSDSPMFSSILLGDAWFNLLDIFGLKLQAELTTLSACETGLSAVQEGDELLGLARGFLYAGTPSLVVSLWTVNDRSTARLMGTFYKNLEAGLSKGAALRMAILDTKRQFPHPYHWAPFVLIGRP